MRRLNLAPAFEPLKLPFPDDCPGIRGDPHVVTLDGLRYDFQAVGEFVALISESRDVRVQLRLAPAAASDRVSYIIGVALNVDGHGLFVDGTNRLAEFDGDQMGEQFEMATDGGALIVRRGDRLLVMWPDYATAITITSVGHRSYLNLYATLDAGRGGRVSGLLGNADGDPANDLALPDGTVVDTDFESLYGPFREGWRVSEATSLFPGPSTFDASLPAGPPEFSREEEAAARALCVQHGVVVRGLLADCTLDVAMTGDEGYAQRYADEQRPRILVSADCPAGVGDLVSMDGYGPERTFASDGGLIEGELQWEFGLEGEDGLAPPLVTGVAATPDGFVIVDTRRGLHFIDRDGRLRRTVDVTPQPHHPAVTTDRVFSIGREGLLAVSGQGDGCWQLLGYEAEMFTSVGFAGGQLIATTTILGLGSIIVIDPESGAVSWSSSYVRPVETWAADSDRLVVGVGGAVIALDAGTGTRQWSAEGGFLIDAIALDGDRAYVVDLNRGLGAYALQTGAEQWRYRPGVTEASGFTQDLALAGGRVVLVNERYALGLDKADGSLAWALGKEDRFRFSQPVIAGDVVYFVRDDLTLVAYDLSSGDQLLRLDLPQRAREAGPPLPFGDIVLLVDRDRVLRAYR